MPTLDKESKLAVNPLSRLKPLKFVKERNDVLVPRRGEYQQPGSGIHYRLEALELVQQNTGKGSISVITTYTGKKETNSILYITLTNSNTSL